MLEYRIYDVSISSFLLCFKNFMFLFLIEFWELKFQFLFGWKQDIKFLRWRWVAAQRTWHLTPSSLGNTKEPGAGPHYFLWPGSAWLQKPLLISPQVLPPFCASTTQFMKPEGFYLPIFGSSPWCRVGFCLFCYVMQNKKGVWEIEISQCKL